MSRVLAALGFLAGCSLTTSTAERLVGESDLPLFVPDDPRFRESFVFTVDDAANNYVVESNASATYDPSIDPDIVVWAFQIGDVSEWPGSAPADERETAAFADVLGDSQRPDTGGPCRTASADPPVLECEYGYPLDDGSRHQYSLLVRRFDTADGTTLPVIATGPGAPDYLAGTFTEVDLDTAIDTWFDP